MVFIPGGGFQMGDGAGSWPPCVHTVELDRFWIGKYQVTQAQYRKVTGMNPSFFKGGNYPVVWVSWNEAMEFCERLSVNTGKRFFLPTEAQWEYACRAGSKTWYCFGHDEALLKKYAWYNKNSDGSTHPVGKKKPNAWGLYDMHGNVCEWCLDWYDKNYFMRPLSMRNPFGPNFGTFRVYRGGSSFRDAKLCRSAHRSGRAPSDRDTDLGFRVVMID